MNNSGRNVPPGGFLPAGLFSEDVVANPFPSYIQPRAFGLSSGLRRARNRGSSTTSHVLRLDPLFEEQAYSGKQGGYEQAG